MSVADDIRALGIQNMKTQAQAVKPIPFWSDPTEADEIRAAVNDYLRAHLSYERGSWRLAGEIVDVATVSLDGTEWEGCPKRVAGKVEGESNGRPYEHEWSAVTEAKWQGGRWLVTVAVYLPDLFAAGW